MAIEGLVRTTVRVTLFAFALGVAATAHAEPITFSIGGASFSAEGDTITLSPASQVLTLPDGPFTTTLQSGVFHVDFSPFVEETFPFTLSRVVTLGEVSQTISQRGLLSVAFFVDTLTLFDAPATTFMLPGRVPVNLTLHGFQTSTTVIGDFPVSITGTFAPVPEPSTLLLVGGGATAILLRARRRRT